MPVETIGAAIDRALDAYAALGELGEAVEDEWTYVTDLTEAWRGRLETLIAERGDDDAPTEVSAAIDRAVDEVGRIADPHRAIDWLSTFPQVVILAVGMRA